MAIHSLRFARESIFSINFSIIPGFRFASPGSKRLLKNPRNVSETSCAEERGVRRSRCRQCIGKDELTTLFRATRFVPEGYVTIGPSARPDFLNNALTALPVKSRRTAAPIVIVLTKRGFFTSLLISGRPCRGLAVLNVDIGVILHR